MIDPMLALSRLRICLGSAVFSSVWFGMLSSVNAVILKNDDYVSGAVGVFSQSDDFDTMAVKITGQAGDYPYRLDGIQVLAAGGGATVFAVEVYQDNGAGAAPGTRLFQSADSYLISGNGTFQEIDLSAFNIQVSSGSIRLALTQIGDSGSFGIGFDSAIQAQRNYFKADAGPWQTAEAAGVAGDFIIRARVTTVPEPAPSWLLATGSFWVLTRWRRRV